MKSSKNRESVASQTVQKHEMMYQIDQVPHPRQAFVFVARVGFLGAPSIPRFLRNGWD